MLKYFEQISSDIQGEQKDLNEITSEKNEQSDEQSNNDLEDAIKQYECDMKTIKHIDFIPKNILLDNTQLFNMPTTGYIVVNRRRILNHIIIDEFNNRNVYECAPSQFFLLGFAFRDNKKYGVGVQIDEVKIIVLIVFIFMLVKWLLSFIF
jgi:hypothetical protein